MAILDFHLVISESVLQISMTTSLLRYFFMTFSMKETPALQHCPFSRYCNLEKSCYLPDVRVYQNFCHLRNPLAEFNQNILIYVTLHALCNDTNPSSLALSVLEILQLAKSHLPDVRVSQNFCNLRNPLAKFNQNFLTYATLHVLCNDTNPISLALSVLEILQLAKSHLPDVRVSENFCHLRRPLAEFNQNILIYATLHALCNDTNPSSLALSVPEILQPSMFRPSLNEINKIIESSRLWSVDLVS